MTEKSPVGGPRKACVLLPERLDALLFALPAGMRPDASRMWLTTTGGSATPLRLDVAAHGGLPDWGTGPVQLLAAVTVWDFVYYWNHRGERILDGSLRP